MPAWFVPWEFSWVFLATFVVTSALYLCGARRRAVPWQRRSVFWLGMLLLYLSMHTMVDYYAQHQFFIHRAQQTILHHLVPLLLMAAMPVTVLRAGLPLRWRVRLRAGSRHPVARRVAYVLGHPLLVTGLFVAVILYWLVPHVAFISMLDWRLYRLMNWSMLVTGLMYWWLVLDHRPSPPGRMRPGMRVLSPALTMTPQIVAGAIITFTRHDLYPVFEACGRVFMGLDVLTDQQWGGLITWIAAAFVEAAGAMLAFNHWVRLSARKTRAGGSLRGMTQTVPTPRLDAASSGS